MCKRDSDYSAFVIFDVTQVPYKVVATYKNNTIAPVLYPKAIYKIIILLKRYIKKTTHSDNINTWR